MSLVYRNPKNPQPFMKGYALSSKFYESDEERWNEIDKIREKVAKHFRIPHGSSVLDVLVGHADFSIAIVRAYNVK